MKKIIVGVGIGVLLLVILLFGISFMPNSPFSIYIENRESFDFQNQGNPYTQELLVKNINNFFTEIKVPIQFLDRRYASNCITLKVNGELVGEWNSQFESPRSNINIADQLNSICYNSIANYQQGAKNECTAKLTWYSCDGIGEVSTATNWGGYKTYQTKCEYSVYAERNPEECNPVIVECTEDTYKTCEDGSEVMTGMCIDGKWASFMTEDNVCPEDRPCPLAYILPNCPDGKIVDGGVDKNGCDLPDTCETDQKVNIFVKIFNVIFEKISSILNWFR